MNSQLYITRREHRMKQREVAEKLRMHPQSYHLKESGKREFTISEGKRLARIFNTSLDQLFGEDKAI
ncbi:helix-turn-helix transcriptional regulator [Lentibacillus saliphilus]|uniref:helix-turn-helix transcriptional regulator n=1 Tax=Lentibacillus saliphilus TaxID=2737028 RepID=UPI001C304260